MPMPEDIDILADPSNHVQRDDAEQGAGIVPQHPSAVIFRDVVLAGLATLTLGLTWPIWQDSLWLLGTIIAGAALSLAVIGLWSRRSFGIVAGVAGLVVINLFLGYNRGVTHEWPNTISANVTIIVRDAATDQPISNASVTLSSNSTDQFIAVGNGQFKVSGLWVIPDSGVTAADGSLVLSHTFLNAWMKRSPLYETCMIPLEKQTLEVDAFGYELLNESLAVAAGKERWPHHRQPNLTITVRLKPTTTGGGRPWQRQNSSEK
jgi:hypothetical protein